jgi:hypothetical protein
MTKQTVLIDQEIRQCQTELLFLQAGAEEQKLRNECERNVWIPAPNYQPYQHIQKKDEIVVKNAKADKRFINHDTLTAILGKGMSAFVTSESSIFFPVKMKIDPTDKNPIQIEINSEVTLPITELEYENKDKYDWQKMYSFICDKRTVTIQAAMLLMYEVDNQLAFKLYLTIEISENGDSYHECPTMILKTPNRPPP